MAKISNLSLHLWSSYSCYIIKVLFFDDFIDIFEFIFQVHTESSFHHKRHPRRYPGWPRTRNNPVKSGFKSGRWSGKSRFARGNGSGRRHQLHIAAARGRWTSIWSSFIGTTNLDLRKMLVTPKIFLKSRFFLISNL